MLHFCVYEHYITHLQGLKENFMCCSSFEWVKIEVFGLQCYIVWKERVVTLKAIMSTFSSNHANSAHTKQLKLYHSIFLLENMKTHWGSCQLYHTWSYNSQKPCSFITNDSFIYRLLVIQGWHCVQWVYDICSGVL